MIPFWGIYRDIVVSIAGGSPCAYLAVVPVLSAIIAVGYRVPPRGVGDPESDWILAAMVGGLGLFLRHLMSNRFPTLSGLWQLPLVGAVLWAACLAAVLFGVRRVMQTWPLWFFLLAVATPLPYLLLTAAAGGGTVVAAAATGLLGAVAVVIAGTLSPLWWRLGVGGACWALSVGVGVAAAGAGLDRLPQHGLILALATGAVIPLAGFLVLQGNATATDPLRKAIWPRRSPLSLIALVVGAVVVFALNVPYVSAEPAPARADGDWAQRLDLPEKQHFSFIERYLGTDASFVRLAVPSLPGHPEAAVDIITVDNRAALSTYRDAIWYPATVPPNYQPVDLGNAAIADGRAASTDSLQATDGTALDWYILTWLWQAGPRFQQVFIVVNQTWTSRDAPPAPARLSLRATVIGPALWLMRQQPSPSTDVDPLVRSRAEQIAGDIIAAGRPVDGRRANG